MRNVRYTLERIEAERLEIKRKLKKKEEMIAHDVELINTPPPADDNPLGFWFNNAGRMVAVYDGVMTGYKLMRALGSLISWRGRRRKNR